MNSTIRSKTLVGEAGSFSHTLRSLQADRSRASLILLIAVMALLCAWVGWFLLARVSRYEVSNQARLEVDKATHFIQAVVSGQVISSQLILDDQVARGDVLVELDSDSYKLKLEEERTRLAAIPPQISAVQQEIRAAGQARNAGNEASSVAFEQAQAQYREAEALARFAEQEADRLRQLREQGLVAEREFVRGMTESQRSKAAAEGLLLGATRLQREQKTQDQEREGHLNQLTAELRRLQGLELTAVATIERLEYEIEKRRIRAPVAGRLADVALLRPGGFIQEGETLCAIVPSGTLHITAMFPPRAALGHIQPGQPGRLRLDGFAWAQYGFIEARVSRVGHEIRDGQVRVELEVSDDHSPSIPLQHGLPGMVEVEVERVSPAVLVLRAAGQLVASHRDSFSSQDRDKSSGGLRAP